MSGLCIIVRVFAYLSCCEGRRLRILPKGWRTTLFQVSSIERQYCRLFLSPGYLSDYQHLGSGETCTRQQQYGMVENQFYKRERRAQADTDVDEIDMYQS